MGALNHQVRTALKRRWHADIDMVNRKYEATNRRCQEAKQWGKCGGGRQATHAQEVLLWLRQQQRRSIGIHMYFRVILVKLLLLRRT